MPEATKRKIVQLDARHRKDRILQAAIRAFSRWGFRGSTTKRLASEARISEALLYRYFQNKEALFKSVLDHMRGRFETPLPQSESTDGTPVEDRDFFLGLAANIHSHCLARPEEIRMLLHAALEKHPLAHDYFKEQSAPILEAVASRIESGQRAGRYRNIDPSVAARTFMGMINYSILIRVLFKDSLVSGWNVADASLFVDIFLNGICNENA